MTPINDKVTRMEVLEELNQIGLAPHVGGDPGELMSRADAAVVLAAALPPLNTGFAGVQPAPFRDLNSLSPEQHEAVSTLYTLGIVVGDDQLMFRGDQKLTRAELGVIVDRTQLRLQAASQGSPGFPVQDPLQTPVQKPEPVGTPAYEVISNFSTLPVEVQNTAISLQGKVGAVTQDVEGSTYLILTAGERYTGGYAIEVTSVTQTGARTEVAVNLQTPDPNAVALQAITYPQAVVRFDNTAKPVALVNSEALAL